jgi:hypothetical protein
MNLSEQTHCLLTVFPEFIDKLYLVPLRELFIIKSFLNSPLNFWGLLIINRLKIKVLYFNDLGITLYLESKNLTIYCFNICNDPIYTDLQV